MDCGISEMNNKKRLHSLYHKLTPETTYTIPLESRPSLDSYSSSNILHQITLHKHVLRSTIEWDLPQSTHELHPTTLKVGTRGTVDSDNWFLRLSDLAVFSTILIGLLKELNSGSQMAAARRLEVQERRGAGAVDLS